MPDIGSFDFMHSLVRQSRFIIACAAFFAIAACGGASGSGTTTSNNPPPAPITMSAAGGDGEVVISWNSVAGATNYNVYWSTASGVTKQTG